MSDESVGGSSVKEGSVPSAVAGEGGRLALAQRRFVLGLALVLALWASLFLYVDRGVGRGAAVVFGALSLVALSGYVLFHRRLAAGGSGGGEWLRRSRGPRLAALAVSLGSGLAGAWLFQGGMQNAGRVGIAVSAALLLVWARIGSSGVAEEAPGRGSGIDDIVGQGEADAERTALLPAAQVDFLWGLSALVLCGFLLLFVVAIPDLQRPGPALGLAAFALLALGVFVRLVRMTWPILAAPGGAWLVKGALISSGVFVVGLGTSSYILICAVPELMETAMASEEAAELVRVAPAGNPIPPPVAWPRPLPGDADLIELGGQDLNVRADGSIYERVADAVVTIRTRTGHGTAFLITRDGLAITNHHVVDDERSLVAVFRDGSERRVRVVRSSETPDVALLQIACESDCTTVQLGADAELRTGAEVLVVGTPEAELLHHSLTRGIISNLRYDTGSTAIQTDAAINMGNSGSPILDAGSGRVVGIVTSSLRGSDVEGVHFGIAISDALRELGVRPASGQ